MDEILNPNNLEGIIKWGAAIAGFSTAIDLGYVACKIRNRRFNLYLVRALYESGRITEKPTFLNVHKLDPFNPKSKYYRFQKKV